MTMAGCKEITPQNNGGDTDTLWNLPKNDFDVLREADYKSLTQNYDDHVLENRDLTFGTSVY